MLNSDESSLMWPHDYKGPRYNDFGQKQKLYYRQLDFRQLVAGELNIILSKHVDRKEREARLQLLSDASFNYAFYQWPAVLRLHAAILSEIENGHAILGDNFSRLEQQMFMQFPLVKAKNKGDVPSKKG